MQNKIKAYIKENEAELYRLIFDLCHIPAPSHLEQKRAEYCRDWFIRNGMTDAYIDGALNAVCPHNADGCNALTVFVAHTDTVFPDTEPMPYSDDGEFIRCPGVGDDTASLAVLMLVAKFFKENSVDAGVLFVANSCEEGLGNLKGTRQIFVDYAGRIDRFISFDTSNLTTVADRCVGSHRYEIEALTEGGHSWAKFGNKNAIAVLAAVVNSIYSIELPKKDGKKVTYNVGEISGGTSVNTIAQQACMLCEYRSDDEELLALMEKEYQRIFESANGDGTELKVRRIGERPCAGDVDQSKIEALKARHAEIVRELLGKEVVYTSSSTDCNIPLSLGIPALCIGVYDGGSSHSREEYVKKSSLMPGLEIGIRSAIEFTKQTD